MLDSLYMRRGQTLIVNKKAYRFYNDTVVFLHKGISYRIMDAKERDFFNKLQQKAQKYRWTRELHNIIVARPASNQKTDSVATMSAIQPFMIYSGMIVRSIRMKRLTVFGPTVSDTSAQPVTWFGRTGNRFHIRSKEFLIRKNLLFSEGQRIDPSELANNERILRSLPYIEDARILLKRASAFSDSVDVVVITKDNWAEAFNFDLSSANAGVFEIWNSNILGLGQEVQHSIPWDSHKKPSVGYMGVYKVNNLAGTFINSKITYTKLFSDEIIGLQVQRDFFSHKTKYAGGLSMYQISTHLESPNEVSELPNSMKYYSYDYWFGRSFLLNPTGFSNMQKNLTFSTRFIYTNYLDRPSFWTLYDNEFQNKNIWISSVSFTKQTFLKSSYIYNFGRTEDIAIGHEFSLIGGVEKGEPTFRNYLALDVGQSFFGNWGYLYLNFVSSTFLTKSQRFEQSLISTQANYFTPLIIANSLKIRQFFNLSYACGFNRKNYEYLDINNKNGLIGFRNDSLRGQSRFTSHWETDFFTPWNYLDFRFTFLVSADHAWIGNTKDLFKKWPYTGINVGLRIRNERLVFKTVQIRFTYYPNLPTGSVTRIFDVSGEAALNAHNFSSQAPALSEYK